MLFLGVFIPEKIRHSTVQLGKTSDPRSLKFDVDQHISSSGNCQIHLHALASNCKDDDCPHIHGMKVLGSLAHY